MSNYYKNIIKNFTYKFNEQYMPIQHSEETVELTQAETEKTTIELDDGTILDYVEQLKGFNHIDVYVDENDHNVKYVVSSANDELEDLAAQAWAKQIESGFIECDVMPWEFIIAQGDLLGMLDSKAIETIAKALASSSLDIESIKQTAEAIWGNDLKSLAKQIITFDGIEKTGFLSLNYPEMHDVKDSDMFAMRYEFEA